MTEKNLHRKHLSLMDLYRCFLGLAIIEGMLAFWFLYRVPSETQSGFLFGFSLPRIILGIAILFIIGLFLLLLFDSLKSQKTLKSLQNKLQYIVRNEIYLVPIKSLLIIILVSSLASILFYLFPDLQRFIFFLPNNYIFQVLGERAGFFVAWIFLLDLKLLVFYVFSGNKPTKKLKTPARLMMVTLSFGISLILLFFGWSLISRKLILEGFIAPGVKIVVLFLWFSLWATLDRNHKWAGRLFQLFVCISIGLVVFLVSLQFAQWFNVWGPRPDDQFILMASSFLRGKIYFVDVPYYLHDLTFFNGNWYLACPPFPIMLIAPFVAIWGVHAFNINTFALLLQAISTVIMYLILVRMSHLGWIKLSQSGAIWLTVLFAFGTVNWWLSVLGTAGFFSQVVTVLFCGLAFFTALTLVSPWVTGICLMAAVMSRPNVFVLWPALVAIVIQLTLSNGKINWRKVLKWALFSAIPVTLGAILLLLYNYLRFDNILDFGYATINGSKTIVQNVQKHGLFNLYFVKFNLQTMFINWPDLLARCGYFFNRGDGLSIFMTSPAIIYVVRKFKFSWWASGCWVSIILSIALLATYSNNGSNQYGYRYLMDFIFPIMMIIGYNVGEKISGFLKALIIGSILINYYGTISWFLSPC